MMLEKLKKLFCKHYSRTTFIEAKDDYVIAKTTCNDCGKEVEPHEYNSISKACEELLIRSRQNKEEVCVKEK